MTKADEDAIWEIQLRFNEAWGRHDPVGMVGCRPTTPSSLPSTAHGPKYVPTSWT